VKETVFFKRDFFCALIGKLVGCTAIFYTCPDILTELRGIIYVSENIWS
jgi:hypothetical protein